MRICLYNLTAGFKTGGLETFTWGLAEALLGIGHEVEVVAGCGERTSPVDGIRLTQFPFVRREKFPDLGTRFRKMAERLSFARNAFSYVRDGGFDAVLINKPYDFPVLKLLKRAGYRGVTCYNSGGTEFYLGDRWLSRAVDLWLPCSAFNAGKIHAHYGHPFTVLHNGVDTGRFSPQVECRDLRSVYAIPDDAKIVISVGRLIGLKGGHIVIEALKRSTGLHFVVVGGGAERGRLESLARSLKVVDRVHFAGEVSHGDLPSFLRAADIFVQASIGEEAFGISVVEAMACGLPVIASNGWGLREVVVDGESGLLVPPGHVIAWAEALQFMVDNPETAAQMGAAGRALAVGRFTWVQAARNFEQSVQQLFERSLPRA